MRLTAREKDLNFNKLRLTCALLTFRLRADEMPERDQRRFENFTPRVCLLSFSLNSILLTSGLIKKFYAWLIMGKSRHLKNVEG